LYTATVDGPALLNGMPIHVSTTPVLASALALTSISQKEGADRVQLGALAQLATRVQKLRVLGSAALDICRVARGQADAYWEPGIYLWDMSAAGLVAERAGGRSEVLSRGALHQVNYVASNGHLHDEFVTLIRAAQGSSTRTR
jgi:myo-inositol-1(or 4)-monophosphatase